MTLGRHALIMAMAASTLLAACGDDAAADPNRTVRKGGVFVKEEVTQQGGFFYRLEAHYTVKATGEPVDFDIVVACNIRTTNYTYTGPSFVAERYPEVMAKATKDGNAVMIRTPRVCQQLQLDRGHVPDDFVPFAIWFDDVNDLSFGWGYATQDAYDGPGAKIAYRPTDPATGTYTSKITRVSRAEWEAWRKKAAEEWVQIGALPGPWGYADPKDKAGIAEEDRVRALNGGLSLGTYCASVKRVPLDASAVASIVAAAAATPGAHATDTIIAYDVRFPAMVQAFVDVHRRGDKEPIFGGYKTKQIYNEIHGTLLRPPALGYVDWSSPDHRNGGYRALYPRLKYEVAPYDGYKTGSVLQILFDPQWAGFAACSGATPGVVMSPKLGDEWRLPPESVAVTGRASPVYLNKELIFENAKAIGVWGGPNIPRFITRDGFYWGGNSYTGGT